MAETVTIAKIRPLTQIMLIIVSSCIIWAALYRRLERFVPHDPAPPIFNVTPETYNYFGGFPDEINVGLYISQFRKFNMVTDEFDFNGILWFEFNPDTISLETLEKFDFEKGEIKYKSNPDTQLVDGKLLVRYNIRVACNSQLDYASFPLDNHRIHLTLANHFVAPSTILFSSSEDQFIVNTKTKSFGWQQVNKNVATGFEKVEIDPYDNRKTSYYPVTIFTLDYVRYGIRYVLSIILPLLLLFYLSLFSFSWPGKQEGAGLSLTLGGVTATLGYRFVIENLSPKTGYFMLSDYIFFLFLVTNSLIFFIQVMESYTPRILTWAEKFSTLLFLHSLVIISCIYLFLFWD